MRLILEDRFLFDASLVRTTKHVDNNTEHHDAVKSNDANSSIKNLVFIDSRISNISTLLNGLKPDAKAIKVDLSQNGIQEITNTLKNYKDLQSISIVGYGQKDELQIGSSKLTNDTTKDNKDIASWGTSMSSGGEIYLYGCDVGHSSDVVRNIDIDTRHNTFAADTKIGDGVWVVEDINANKSIYTPFTDTALREYSDHLDLTDATLTGGYGNSSDTHNDALANGQAFVPGTQRDLAVTINLAPNETITNNGNDLVIKTTLPDGVNYIPNTATYSTSNGVTINSNDVNIVQNGNEIELHLGKSIVNTTSSIASITANFGTYLGSKFTDGQTVTPTFSLDHDGKTITTDVPMTARLPQLTVKTQGAVSTNNYAINNNVSYTFTVANNGDVDAYNSVVSTAFSKNLINVTVTDDQGNTYKDPTNVSVGEIPAGTVRTFTVTGTVSANLDADKTATILPSVTYNGAAANNSAITDIKNTTTTDTTNYIDTKMTTALGLDKVPTPTVVVTSGGTVIAGNNYESTMSFTNNTNVTQFNPFIEIFASNNGKENSTINSVGYLNTTLQVHATTLIVKDGVVGAYEPLSSSYNYNPLFVAAPPEYKAGDTMYSVKLPLTSMVPGQSLNSVKINYNVSGNSSITSVSNQNLYMNIIGGYLTGSQPVFNSASTMVRGNSISSILAISDHYYDGGTAISRPVELVDIGLSAEIVSGSQKSPENYPNEGYTLTVTPGSQTEDSPVKNYSLSFKLPEGAVYDGGTITPNGFRDVENPTATVKDGVVTMHFDQLSYDPMNVKTIFIPLKFTSNSTNTNGISYVNGPKINYSADTWVSNGQSIPISGIADESSLTINTMPYVLYDRTNDPGTNDQDHLYPGDTINNDFNIASSDNGTQTRNMVLTVYKENSENFNPDQPVLFKYVNSEGQTVTLNFNLDKSTLQSENIAGQTIYTSGSGSNFNFSRDSDGVTKYTFNISAENEKELGTGTFPALTTGHVLFGTTVNSRYTAGPNIGQPFSEDQKGTNNSFIDGEYKTATTDWTHFQDSDQTNKTIMAGSTEITVHAVDGDTSYDKAQKIIAGSDITYTSTYNLSTSNYDSLRLIAYLPSGIYNAANPANPTGPDLDVSAGNIANVWKEDDAGKGLTVGTYSLDNAPAGVTIQSVSVDPASNALIFTLSPRNGAIEKYTSISISYTVKSSDVISKSDIPVAVQGESDMNYTDSNPKGFMQNSITQSIIAQPFVFQKTGVVSIVNSDGTVDSAAKYESDTASDTPEGKLPAVDNADPTTVYGSGSTLFVNGSPTDISSLQNLDVSKLSGDDKIRIATSIKSATNNASGDIYEMEVKGTLPSNISTDSISNLQIVRSDGAVMKFVKPDGSPATVADYFNGGVLIENPDGTASKVLSGNNGNQSLLTVFYDVDYKAAVSSIGNKEVFSADIIHYSNKLNGSNYSVNTSTDIGNLIDKATITNSDPVISRDMGASTTPEDDNSDSAYPNQTLTPGEVRPIDITLNLPKGTLTNSGNDVVVTETIPDNVKYVAGSGKITLADGQTTDATSVVQNGNTLEFHLGTKFVNDSTSPIKLSYNAYLDKNGNDGDVKTFTAQLHYDGDAVNPVSTSIVEHDPAVTTSLVDNGGSKLSAGENTTYSLSVDNTGKTTAFNTTIALGLNNLNITSVKDSEGNVYTVNNGNIVISSLDAGKNLLLSINTTVSPTLPVDSTVSLSANTTWTSVPSGDGMKTYSSSQTDTKETPPFLTSTKIGAQLTTGIPTYDGSYEFTSDLKTFSHFYEGGIPSSNDVIGGSSAVVGTLSIPTGVNNNVHVVITLPKGVDINSPVFGAIISENGIQSADTTDQNSVVNASNQITGVDTSTFDPYHANNWINLTKQNNILSKVRPKQNSDGTTTIDIDLGSLNNSGTNAQSGMFLFGYISRVLNTSDNVAGKTLTTNFNVTYSNQNPNDVVNNSVTQTVIEPNVTISKVVSSIDQSTGTVTYTDTVTNTGDAEAYDVFINDKFGSGYDPNSFTSITPVDKYLAPSANQYWWVKSTPILSDGVSHDTSGVTVKLNTLDIGKSFSYSYSVKLQSTTSLSGAGVAKATWDDVSQVFMSQTFNTVLQDWIARKTTLVNDFDQHWVWSIPTGTGSTNQQNYGSTIYTPRDGSGQLPQDNYVSTSQAGVGIMSGRMFTTLGDDIKDYTKFSSPIKGANLSITSQGSQTTSGGVTSTATSGSDGNWSMIVANGTGNLTVSNVPSNETLVYDSLSPDSSNTSADNNLTINSNQLSVDHVYELQNTEPTLSVTSNNNSDEPFKDASFNDDELNTLSGATTISDGFTVQRYINGNATPYANDVFSIKNANGYTTDANNNVYKDGTKVGSYTMTNGVFTFTYAGSNDAATNKSIINDIINQIVYKSPDLNGSMFISRELGVTAFDGNTTSIASQNGGTGAQGTGGNMYSTPITQSLINSAQSEQSIRGIQNDFTYQETNNQDPSVDQLHIFKNVVISFDKGATAATVNLGGLAEDKLIIDNSQLGGLQATISTDGKSLTLTGNASNEVYENAIHSIGFIDTSTTPNTVYNRQAVISITDTNGVTLAGQTGNINVSATNDSPILTGNGSSNDVTETHTGTDTTPAQTDGTSLTKLIGSYTDSDGNNAHDGQTITPDGVVIAGVDTTHGSYWYTTDGGNTWTEFASKNISYNPYTDKALRLEINDQTKIAFVPTDVNFNGLVTDAVSYRIWDHSDGKSVGLGDAIPDNTGTGINTAGAAYSGTVNQTGIMVDGINNAPIATGNITLNDTENTINGRTVTDIAKVVFNDAADQQQSGANPYGTVANNFAGIAITGATTSTFGHWAYLDNNGNWQSIGNVSDQSALILSKDTVVKFIPTNTNYNGTTPTLLMRVIDDSKSNGFDPSALNGQYADVTNNGGTSAISGNAVMMNDIVSAVHQGPDIVNATTQQSEEDERGGDANTINNLFTSYFSDSRDNQYDAVNNPNGSHPSNFAGIIIVGNGTSSEGIWQWQDSNGNWNNIGNVSSTSGLVLDKNTHIRFAPTQTTYPGQDSTQAAGFNGVTRPLTVKFYDSSATFSTGQTIDTTQNTNYVSPENMTYTEKVDSINNAPYAKNDVTQLQEQNSVPVVINVGNTLGAGYTDANDNQQTSWNPTGTQADPFAGIAITSNPTPATQGVWQYQDSSGNWQLVGNVSTTNALVLDTNANLRFVAANNFNGQPTLSYHVIDGSGSTIVPIDEGEYEDVSQNGGSTSVSLNTENLILNVAHVNHAPVTLGSDVSFSEKGDEDKTDGPAESVSSLVGSVFDDSLDNQRSASNPDGSVASVLSGVAVVNTPQNSEGNWQYQDSNGNWQNIGQTSDKNALILSASTNVRFTPSAHFNGDPQPLTVRLIESASDIVDKNAGNFTDVSTNGGTSSISSGTVNIHQSVTSENNAPEANGIGQMPSTAEDHVTPTTVGQAFGSTFSDPIDNQKTDINPDGSLPNNFAGVAITDNETPASEGKWQYQDSNGNWNDVGQVSDKNALILGKDAQFRFLPAENFNGLPSSLTAHVIDDSGSQLAVGATDTFTQDISNITGGRSSISDSTTTINQIVTPVNNAPVIKDYTDPASIDTRENGSVTTTAGDLFSKYFDDSADNQKSQTNPTGSVPTNFAGIAITSTTDKGTWYVQAPNGNMIPVTSVSDTNALIVGKDTQLTFKPNQDFNGQVPALTGKLVSDYNNVVKPDSVFYGDSTYKPDGIFSAGYVQASSTVDPVVQPPSIDGDTVISKGSSRHPTVVTAESLLSGYSDHRNDNYSINNPTGTKPYPDGGIVIMGSGQTAGGVWTYTINGQVHQLPDNLSPTNALILPKDTVFTFSPTQMSKGLAKLDIAGYAANPNVVFINGRTGADIAAQGIVQGADVTHSVLLTNQREFLSNIVLDGGRPILTGVTENDYGAGKLYPSKFVFGNGLHRNPYRYVFKGDKLDIGNMMFARSLVTTFTADNINDMVVKDVEGSSSANQLDGTPLPSWLHYDSYTNTFHGTPGDHDSSVNAVVTVRNGSATQYINVHIGVEESPLRLAALWSELGIDHNLTETGNHDKTPAKPSLTRTTQKFHERARKLMKH